MNKILLSSLSLIIFLYNTSLSQSDSIQWNKLIKQHKNVEIIYDDYIDKFWTSLSSSPQIFVDTIIALEPNELNTLPSPIEGIEKFVASINFPEIAKRAGLEGNVVINTTIDIIGNPKDVEVKLSDAEIFSYSVIEAVKKTKFIPAIQNGKPIEAQIAIAFSFVLYRKKNVQIDTIIVDKSACLGTCPSYIITLSKNGEVTYDGRYYVDKIGKWKSTFHKSEFEGLTSIIFATNFLGMKETYSTNATDFPWVTITVVTEELTKKVKTDYYLPIWEIAKLVDYITEDLNWEKVKE